MIQAEDLSKTYPNGTQALRHVSFSVEPGSMVFLRGQSGAGKTTLFRLITGMEKPSGGCLLVDGIPMDEASGRLLRDLRRRMGIVFQDFRLVKGRTTQENVELGMRVIGVGGTTMRERARDYLEKVGLTRRAQAPVESLSFGERQRLELARALARKPSLIIADEPTGNLDQELTSVVMELLSSAHRDGATVLVATHAQSLLESTSHRVMTLADGCLVCDTRARSRG